MYTTQAWSQVRYGSPSPSVEKAIVPLKGPRDRYPARKRTGGILVDMCWRHGGKRKLR